MSTFTWHHSKKALFEDIQKGTLRMINGKKDSVMMDWVSSMRSKMCAFEVFLNGSSSNAFQNYFMRINHGHCTPANTKDIILPQVRWKQEGRPFRIKEL